MNFSLKTDLSVSNFEVIKKCNTGFEAKIQEALHCSKTDLSVSNFEVIKKCNTGFEAKNQEALHCSKTDLFVCNPYCRN